MTKIHNLFNDPLIHLLLMNNVDKNNKPQIKHFKMVLKNAIKKDQDTALKILMFKTDPKNNGFRDLLKIAIQYLSQHETELGLRLMQFIMQIGRLDGLFYFFNTPLHQNAVIEIIKLLKQDINNYNQHLSISLMSKWVVNPKTNPIVFNSLVKQWDKKLYLKNKTVAKSQFKQILKTLRKYLNLFEYGLINKNVDFSVMTSTQHTYYKKVLNTTYKEMYEYFVKSKQDKIKTTHLNVEKLIQDDLFSNFINQTLTNLKNPNVSMRLFLKKSQDMYDKYVKTKKSQKINFVLDTSGSMFMGDLFANAILNLFILMYQTKTTSYWIFSSSSLKIKFNYENSIVDNLILLYETLISEQNKDRGLQCYGGGTNLESVLKKINNQNPIMIITDAEFNMFHNNGYSDNESSIISLVSKTNQITIWDISKHKELLVNTKYDNVIYFKNNHEYLIPLILNVDNYETTLKELLVKYDEFVK